MAFAEKFGSINLILLPQMFCKALAFNPKCRYLVGKVDAGDLALYSRDLILLSLLVDIDVITSASLPGQHILRVKSSSFEE